MQKIEKLFCKFFVHFCINCFLILHIFPNVKMSNSNVQFSQRQLPKSVLTRQCQALQPFLTAALGPQPILAAEFGSHWSLRCGASESEGLTKPLGSCRLGNCNLGDRPWENAFVKIPNTISDMAGVDFQSNLYLKNTNSSGKHRFYLNFIQGYQQRMRL